MGRLNNSDFLTQASQAILQRKGKSIYLTQKRLNAVLEKPEPSSFNDLPSQVVEQPEKYPHNSTTYAVLVRLKTGDFKLSTVVEAENLAAFWPEYVQTVKEGFVGLRKEKKKKSAKTKVTR